MKKINIILLALCGVVALSSCFGGKSNMKLAVGSPQVDYHLDQAKVGLLGPVKSVEIKKENFKQEFDNGGALIGSDNSLTKYLDRMRFDVGPKGNIIYTYDELGRLLNESGPGYSYDYVYEGNNYFPASMSGTDESGSVSHQYSYKPSDFDKYGNWTSRKDNKKSVKRKIEYYF